MAFGVLHLLSLCLYGFSVAAGYPSDDKPAFMTTTVSVVAKVATIVFAVLGTLGSLISLSFGAFVSWLVVWAILVVMALVEVAVDGVRVWQLHHHVGDDETSAGETAGTAGSRTSQSTGQVSTTDGGFDDGDPSLGTGEATTDLDDLEADHEDRMERLDDIESEIEQLDAALDETGEEIERTGSEAGVDVGDDSDGFGNSDGFGDSDVFDSLEGPELGETDRVRIERMLSEHPEKMADTLEGNTTINIIDGDLVVDEHQEVTEETNVDESTDIGDDNVMNRPDFSSGGSGGEPVEEDGQ